MEMITITIDRPLGSTHPNHPDIVYPINYGYVEGIPAGDGEWQDVYVLGVDVPLKTFTGKIIAIIHRLDDVEDKWVAAPDGTRFTREQILAQTHFQEQWFQTRVELL